MEGGGVKMGTAPSQVREHLYSVNWTGRKKTLCVLTVWRPKNAGMGDLIRFLISYLETTRRWKISDVAKFITRRRSVKQN